jgi:molecular chaperone Hsp33
MTDSLTKFIFDGATVRGELVELTNTWQQVLQHHDYPPPVRNLLGELCSAAALLFANLKFEGTMVMQIHGDGPIRLLVVECNHQLQIRAMAKLTGAAIDDSAELQSLINAEGHGRFIITLDPADKSAGQQPYQGIVPISGDSIATIIENYMHQSEQLDTRLWLASDNQVSRGMLLQRLPYFGGTLADDNPGSEQEASEHAQHAWERSTILGNTLKRDELLATDVATLMHRLFWEETLRVFDQQTIHFHCSCNRDKVGNMLVMLGREEINDALAATGQLDINCDFCGKPYSFDAVDCAELFTAPENRLPADHIRKH